ncbi:hypothetical protein ACQP2C_26455 [Micromonospora zamorensis]|uniref:hypothetical protein n=1 Tax=Micromonospora zamorensis TaxID=709883 RepID=UPI003D954EAF
MADADADADGDGDAAGAAAVVSGTGLTWDADDRLLIEAYLPGGLPDGRRADPAPNLTFAPADRCPE